MVKNYNIELLAEKQAQETVETPLLFPFLASLKFVLVKPKHH